MKHVAPVKPRIVCHPSGFEIMLELVYTGTRDGMNVWVSRYDVKVPEGTTKFHLAADFMPTDTVIDVEVEQ